MKTPASFSKPWKRGRFGFPSLGNAASAAGPGRPAPAAPISRWRGPVAAALALGLFAVSCRPPAAPDETAGPDFSANVSLSATEIRIGDSLRVELTALHPAGGSLGLPEPAETFEVRRRESRAENARDGRRRHRIVYDLTTFELGERPIFSGPAVWIAPDGSRRESPLEGARVTVRSVLDGVAGPRDLKPPLPWPPPLPRWLWALPAIVVAGLLAALAVRLVARRRERRPPPPPPPPNAVARADLERLRARGWIAAGAVEPFFVELSRIVRVYIEGRFALRAPELTTEEFLRAAARAPALTAEHRARAVRFLEQCDLVKFARARPGAAEMEAAFAAAERFVRETAPAAEPVSGAGGGGA